jgi:Lhr-like helicase
MSEQKKTRAIEENITEVSFERVFNMGNYETCRIGLKATVTPENGVAKKNTGIRQGNGKIQNEHGEKLNGV